MGRDYIAQHRLYLNSHGALCEATDPDVSTLLAAEGGSVPLDRAVALGLVADSPTLRGVESDIGVSTNHPLYGQFSAGEVVTPSPELSPTPGHHQEGGATDNDANPGSLFSATDDDGGQRTSTPGETDSPEKTGTPEQTDTPGQTGTSEQANTPGQTDTPEQTDTPALTNQPDTTREPASRGKTRRHS